MARLLACSLYLVTPSEAATIPIFHSCRAALSKETNRLDPMMAGYSPSKTPYSEDSKLQRAYRRGKEAAKEGERVPRSVLEGSRDVHAAWLDGYMEGASLSG